MALRNFTLLTLACHSEEESKYLRACQNHTKKTWIFQAPAAPAMKKLLFCWMRKDAGSVDALGVYLLRRYVCVLSKTVLCLSAPKLCFTVTSAAPDTWKKRQSHWSDSFWRSASNQKNEPEAFLKKLCFYAWRFSRRCAHSHWHPLFSHEALNVGE